MFEMLKSIFIKKENPFSLRAYVEKRIELDTSLFLEYPITSLAQLVQNAEQLGIKRVYLGGIFKIKETPEWQHIGEQFLIANSDPYQFDPVTVSTEVGAKIDPTYSWQMYHSAVHVVGVQFESGKYQFAKLKMMSNDTYNAVEYIKRLKKDGVVVDGDYKKLLNVPELVTLRHPMYVLLFIVLFTLLFMAVAMYVQFTYYPN